MGRSKIVVKMIQTKVREWLADVASAQHDPIPLSSQYLRAFEPEECEEDGEADDEPVPRAATFRRKGKALKKPGKKAKRKTKVTPKAVSGVKRVATQGQAEDSTAYSPHLYSERAKIFILAKRSDGATNKEAREMWLGSSERAKMLADLSLGELKRRRFVPKGASVNPFVAILGGA